MSASHKVPIGVSKRLEPRVYLREESVVFQKTKEQFGGLSNMAANYPIRLDTLSIRTSEALYQACRFPQLPDIQEKIINQYSPMTAKMVSKPYRQQTRGDWEKIKVRVMRWCLRVKLAQNWNSFGKLLLSTGDKPIVEQSRRDDFWGAKAKDEATLVGTNILGRLLTELREDLKHDPKLLRIVPPPKVEFFYICGQPIGTVTFPSSRQITHDMWFERAQAQPDLFSES